MKNIFFTTLFLLGIYCTSYCQDWQAIDSVQIKYFSGYPDSAGTYSIRIDSVDTINNNIIYYNMPIWSDEVNYTQANSPCGWGSGCRASLKPGWLGPGIRQDSNGVYYFSNSSYNIFSFDFNILGNDTSCIFKNDSMQLKMVLISQDTASILSYPDSVRTYRLTHTKANNTDTLELHGSIIKLGKQLGLIQFFDVYNFPDKYTPVKLLGMKNPNIGLYEITEQDIYDYNVGDIFEFRKGNSDSDHYGYYSYSSTTTKQKILSKTSTSDYVQYEVYQRKIIENGRNGYTDSNSYFEYNTLTYYKSIVLASIPFDNPLLKKSISFIDTCVGERIALNTSSLDYTYCPEFNCFGGKDFGGGGSSYTYTYITGMGLVDYFSSCPSGGYNYYYGQGLNYFANDSISCGEERLEPLSIKEKNNNGSYLSAYPNPFNNETVLHFNNLSKGNCQVQIYNITGKLVRTYDNVTTNKLVIKRNELTQGLYFVIITDNELKRHSLKLQISSY